MTRVFHCSTPLGAVLIAAAIDGGRFGGHDERRVLLVSTMAPAAEACTAMHEHPAFASVRDRFDDVVSWNDVIAPLHPAAWTPDVAELAMLSRLIEQRLGLGGAPQELVLESVTAPPARTVADVIRDCPITVYCDSLRVYGPTAEAVPPETAGRVRQLLYLDLEPSLAPRLLSDWDVPAQVVHTAAVRQIVDSMTSRTEAAPAVGRRALLVGLHLSSLGVISADEEAQLQARAVTSLVRAGYSDIVVKPHPSADPTYAHGLRAAAGDARCTVADAAEPAEVSFAAFRPDLVVGCTSTALLTASRMYDIPVATTGAELVLGRLTPYEHADRIPATIVDATVPCLQPDGRIVAPPEMDLRRLVDAVSYTMRSVQHPDLRPAAVDHLAVHGPGRYFDIRRLRGLDLVDKVTGWTDRITSGSLPSTLRTVAADRIRRRVRG